MHAHSLLLNPCLTSIAAPRPSPPQFLPSPHHNSTVPAVITPQPDGSPPVAAHIVSSPGGMTCTGRTSRGRSRMTTRGIASSWRLSKRGSPSLQRSTRRVLCAARPTSMTTTWQSPAPHCVSKGSP